MSDLPVSDARSERQLQKKLVAYGSVLLALSALSAPDRLVGSAAARCSTGCAVVWCAAALIKPQLCRPGMASPCRGARAARHSANAGNR